MSPGSGTTATGFGFAVTYLDSGGCAPTSIVVHINGLGDYPLGGPGTGFDSGVVFSRTLTFGTPGTYTYSFQASSGTGPGAKSVTLTGVSPSSFTVSAPPPPPPTPRPTPVPPPPATPPPATPVPTPTPSSTQTPAASTATPTVTPGETSAASPSPRAGTPSSSPSAGGILPGGASPRPGSSRGVSFSPPQPVVRFAEWAAITVGALGLFLFLAGRRPRQEEPAAAGIVFPNIDPADPGAGSVHEPRVLTDEANMPRWLRPSVQAARRGRYLRD